MIRYHPQYLGKILACVYKIYQERQAFYDDRMASTESTCQLRYEETPDKKLQHSEKQITYISQKCQDDERKN